MDDTPTSLRSADDGSSVQAATVPAASVQEASVQEASVQAATVQPAAGRGAVRTTVPATALATALVAGVGLLAACTSVPGAGGEFRDPDAPPRTITVEDIARRAITPRDIDRSVGFLASDELRGRATPSRGLARAGSWVAERFQLAGLEPAGDGGGYVQYWPSGRDTARALNVVGLLPGADLTRAGEPVVLLAHLDHLGVGEPDESGDSIYNGADDNATGVAALVEIADAFAALPARPARPVVFLAVSGREQGGRGARWFVEHPTVELAHAVAVLNLDMIGRNHPDTVAVLDDDSGVGNARRLGDRLAAVAASHRLGLTVTRSAGPRSTPATPTDHDPFAAMGLPAVTITTGTHADHHRPTDEAGRVDEGKAARVARLVFLTAHQLAAAP